jgi:hypothetical protein
MVLGAAVSWEYSLHPLPPFASDFSIVWAGARELRAGGNPYEIVGPGKPHEFPFPLIYPLPAILFGLPFSYLPLAVADPLFVALSAGALAWGLTRAGPTWNLLVFPSMAWCTAAQVGQWSPLLVAGALVPSLGWVLACKPTIAAALWLAYPSKRAALLAGTFVIIAFIVRPGWVPEWLALLPLAPHLKAPVTFWGGPLILLALVKWRRPEARLLAAMACVPQTAVIYEAVPLFLVVKTMHEGLALLLLCMVAVRIADFGGPYESYNAIMQVMGQWNVLLIYLPCLVMVLRRPNVHA